MNSCFSIIFPRNPIQGRVWKSYTLNHKSLSSAKIFGSKPSSASLINQSALS
uniref:Uncharacterized protein n=1 Tax=uncultured marine virus TaxID=186617 RepID=A0A0F7L7V0_9VIRU|nr:hypothetical protein [uncultured marine virus]